MSRFTPPSRLRFGLRSQLKQLDADRGVPAAIVAAVFVCALFLAATPLLFAKMAEQALLEAVSEPQAQLRNITASLSSTIGVGPADTPFDRVADRGETFRETQLPDTVEEIVYQTTWVADSPQFVVSALPGTDDRPVYSSGRYAGTLMRMRYQSDVEEHVSLTAGALPQPHDPITLEFGNCDATTDEAAPEDLECRTVETPVIEVAVSQETLDYLPVDVGGMVLLTPSVGDSAYFGLPLEDLQYNIALKISGLIEIDDPSDDYWFNDPRLLRPRLRSNADFTFVFSTGLMSPDDYRRLLRQTGSARWTYQWRYFVGPDRVAEASLEELSADLSKLQNEYRPSAFAGARKVGVNTKLPSLITEYEKRRTTTIAVLSTSLAGLTAATVGMVLLLSAISTERQRSSLTLLRSRGASRRQMGIARATQGSALIVPPAAIALASVAVFIASPVGFAGRLVAALVVLATLFFVAAASPVIFADVGLLARRHGRVARPTRRRAVLDGLVVVAALAAIVIVRRRGFVGAGETEPDALLAVTPALTALAAGLVLVRLGVYPMRLLAHLSVRRTGLTLFVGLKRALQQPATARLPLVVMVIALALATFTLTVRSSLHGAQVQTSWQVAGASVRVTEANPASPLGDLPDGVVEEVSGAHAYATRFPTTRTIDQAGIPSTIDALFLDLADYSAVTAGTPIEPPSSITAPSRSTLGSADDPLPVLYTAGPGRSIATGEQFAIDIAGRVIHVEVVDQRSDFPTASAERGSIVADLEPLESLVGPFRARPTALFLRSGAASAADITSALRPHLLTPTLTLQDEELDRIRSDRFSRGLDRSLLLTFWFAVFLAAFGAIASLVQSSASRRRDFGYLRTQGLTSRQAMWLTVLEQAPTIILASLAGTAAGALTVVLLEPAINLSPFTGSLIDRGVSVEWRHVAVLGLSVTAGLVALSTSFGYLNRRRDFGGLLRGDGE